MSFPEDESETGLTEDSVVFTRIAELIRANRTSPNPLVGEQLQRANAELELYFEEHPKSVAALRLLAEISLQLGDPQKAHRFIGQAELLDPWNPEILIIAESLADPGEPVGQAASILEAPPRLPNHLSIDLVNTDSLIEKAMSSFQLGELERAYSLAKLAFLLNTEKRHHLLDVWAVGSIGDPRRTYYELTMLENQIGPNPYLYLVLGSTGNVLGWHDRALEWIGKGLAVSSDDHYVTAMLYNEMAYILIRQNRELDKAVTLARTALELFPEDKANGFIRDTLGVAYLKKGELAKAVQNLREAVRKDPTVIPRFHLALALLQQGEPRESLTELRIIAGSRPSMESPHVEECHILERVQSQLPQLENLLNLASPDNLKDAQALVADLL